MEIRAEAVSNAGRREANTDVGQTQNRSWKRPFVAHAVVHSAKDATKLRFAYSKNRAKDIDSNRRAH